MKTVDCLYQNTHRRNFFFGVGFLFVQPNIALAYLDPGNIALAIQLVVSFVAGCIFYLGKPRLLWQLIVDKIKAHTKYLPWEKVKVNQQKKRTEEAQKRLPLKAISYSMPQIQIGSACVIFTFLILPLIPKNTVEIFRGYSPYFFDHFLSIAATLALNFILISVIFSGTRRGLGWRVIECGYLAIIFSVLIKTSLIAIDIGWEWIRDSIWNFPTQAQKIVWFLLLPGTVFFIFISSQNALDRASKTIVAFGVAIILIPGWRFIDSVTQTRLASWENKTTEFQQGHGKKVIWITFDEFDPKEAFTEELAQHLPNFQSLLAESVNAKKNSSPANNTNQSIIAVLTGKATNGVEFLATAHAVQKIPDRANSSFPVEFERTIFKRVKDLELDSMIFGFGLPYCEMFPEVACKAFFPGQKPDWYSGIVAVYMHPKILEFFGMNFSGSGNYANISAYLIQSVEHYLSNRIASLSFIHFNFPHMPSTYAEWYYSEKPESEKQKYLLNLRLADEVLGQILRNLAQNTQEQKLIILNSDHWLRWLKPDGFVTASPSLFLAKIDGDTTRIDIDSPTSSVHIGDLVIKFLKDDIDSHQSLADDFIDRIHYESYIQK